MKRIALVLVLVAVLSSCEDTPGAQPKTVIGPAEATPIVAGATVASLSTVPARLGGSTVCLRYLRDRILLLGELDAAPNDTALVRKAKALTAKLADACN